jgi:DNA (cytosine-5)-methyltransferase 1
MDYGSVFSGIEAATVAWHELGWRAAWLSEIEAFTSALLAHRYPDVPNLGDMTKIARKVLIGEVAAPDVLVGGSPCQAFSVAGLREGLSDERGQLTISYVRLLDAIDYIRRRSGKRPAVAVWENVPGVLSSKDNAFGCFLGALSGEDEELQPPGKKWANAGCVFGPARTIAWRVLDAQYFGVAQRRRRVFVIASARKDFNPADVLFEFDGVRRDFAPSREAGQETAGTLASRTGAGDFPGTDEACSGYLQPAKSRVTWPAEIACTLNAAFGEKLGLENQHINAGAPLFVPSVCVTETFAIQAGALRTNPNSGPDGIGVQSGIAYTMEARAEVQAVCVTGDITHTLKAEGFDASEDGTGRGQPIVTAAFDIQQITSATNRSTVRDGAPAPTIAKASRMHAITGVAVRRLMPIECERLQAFPDSYTQVPVRGKPAADGPRYKALGNSMCVNVMRWIGERIDVKNLSANTTF